MARPDRVKLHNMRVKMEEYEEKHKTIAVSAPLSALKMMKKNVNDINSMVDFSGELTEENAMNLDAEYMGLQVLNPSNKLEIIDPTQIRTIVTGEQEFPDDLTVTLPDGNEMSVLQLRSALIKLLVIDKLKSILIKEI